MLVGPSFTPLPLRNLSLCLNILFVFDISGGDIFVGWETVLVVRGHRFIYGVLVLPVLQPEEDDELSNKHSDSASSHTKGHTNQDRHESELDGCPHDVNQAVEEASLAMAMHVMRAEFEMGRKLNGAVRTTVCSRAVWKVRRVFTSEALEALDAETLDALSSGRRGSLGLVDVVEDFREDTAKHIGAFGVWRIGRWGDSSGREKNHLAGCQYKHRRMGGLQKHTWPDTSLIALISRSSTLTISPSRAKTDIVMVIRLLESSAFCSLNSTL